MSSILGLALSLTLSRDLLCFVLSVALSQGGVVMALREGVEHPYIKECTMLISHSKLSAIYRRPGFNCVVKQLRFWLFKVDCEFKDCDLRVLRIGHTHTVPA